MNPWLTWIYHYGVGGAVAGATLVFAWKAGAINFRRKLDRRLVLALAGGCAGFGLIHALWTWRVLAR